MVELEIDGQAVSVPPGTSILDAAAVLGIEIPALCYDETLTTFGACRLCSVEIEGRPNLAAACSTPVADGLVVYTESETVVDARRTVLDLLLSDHPQDCLICEKAGDCLLQEYCYRYGVEHTSFKGATKCLELDDDNHLIQRDQNKCILCGKCVRVCEEIQGVAAIDFIGRGTLEANTVRTLAFLFLARVDGKSPAEYITEDDDKNLIRKVSYAMVRDNLKTYEDVVSLMLHSLGKSKGAYAHAH